jgi:hypothetical protein
VPPSNRVAEDAANEEAEGVRLASHLEAASPTAATAAASAAVAARTAPPSKLPSAREVGGAADFVRVAIIRAAIVRVGVGAKELAAESGGAGAGSRGDRRSEPREVT